MASSSTTYKIVFKEEMRVLVLPAGHGQKELLAGAGALFGATPARLVYTDADGDGVTVHDDAALSFLIAASAGKTPKLHLIAGESAPAPTRSAAAAEKPALAALREALHASRDAWKTRVGDVAEAALKSHAHMVGHTRKVNALVRGAVKEAKHALKAHMGEVETAVKEGRTAVNAAVAAFNRDVEARASELSTRISSIISASVDEHFHATVGVSSSSDDAAAAAGAAAKPAAVKPAKAAKGAKPAAPAASAAPTPLLTGPFLLTEGDVVTLMAQMRPYVPDLLPTLLSNASSIYLALSSVAHDNVAMLDYVKEMVATAPSVVLTLVSNAITASSRLRVEMGADIARLLRRAGFDATAIDAIFTTPSAPHGAVHRNVACDGCGAAPIVGQRWKCAHCPNFDLCGVCFKSGSGHTRVHEFKAMPEPAPPVATPVGSTTHANVTCDGCGVAPIVGPRFKCAICRDYDLCAACEARSAHDATHPLLKISTTAATPAAIMCVVRSDHEAGHADGSRVGADASHDWRAAPHPWPFGAGHPRTRAWMKEGGGGGGGGWRHHKRCWGGRGAAASTDAAAAAAAAAPAPATEAAASASAASAPVVETVAPAPQPAAARATLTVEEEESRALEMAIAESLAASAPASAAAAPPAAPPAAADLGYTAKFVAAVPPVQDNVKPGEEFKREWRMRNDGTAPWPAGSALIHVSGELLGAPPSIPTPAVPAGGYTDIPVLFKAPTVPGRYQSYWRMAAPVEGQAELRRFGHRVWVDIWVDEPAPVAAAAPVVAPVVAEAPAAAAPAVIEDGNSNAAAVIAALARAPAPPMASVASAAPVAGRWDTHLAALGNMGFTDTRALTALLDTHDGNLLRVIHDLLEAHTTGSTV